jgi:hypothetical protein
MARQRRVAVGLQCCVLSGKRSIGLRAVMAALNQIRGEASRTVGCVAYAAKEQLDGCYKGAGRETKYSK